MKIEKSCGCIIVRDDKEVLMIGANKRSGEIPRGLLRRSVERIYKKAPLI